MAITLKSETQHEIEERMQRQGFADPDELVMAALKLLDQEHEVLDYDDLDEETKAAIDEADAQIAQGLGRPWDEVRKEVFGRYLKEG